MGTKKYSKATLDYILERKGDHSYLAYIQRSRLFLRRSDDSQSGDYLFIAINALALFIASLIPNYLNKKFYIAMPEFLLLIYLGFVTAALLLGEIGRFLFMCPGGTRCSTCSAGRLSALWAFRCSIY